MDMDHSLGLVFSDSLIEVISTVSGTALEILSQDKDNGFDDITGMMSLSGNKPGTLFVSANNNDVRMLCSYMIGVPPEEVAQNDIYDTLCEIVNMTAGSVKLRLSDTDYAFSLSQPFVLKGDGMSIIAKDKTHIISRTFGNGRISVKLKVVY